ncbi:uncharacterized protein LODBEIA_P45390 [Lodderomyces beijingensis]|uniref:Uncharacterized protein n=1 Tax=Lodderomyces beijingensis TaxID=1775926 RepID=A0ABP0ZQ80_9ASCO
MRSKTHLISQPFKTENTRIIRESNKKFPPPNVISFDLFGTLYKPKKPVPEQYYDISHDEFGIAKSAQSIEKDFPRVYSQLQKEYPNYGKGHPQFEHCDAWWRELILRLYGLDKYSDETKALSHRLIHHFTSEQAYDLYADVLPTLETLQSHGVKMVVASNSDSRALTILQSLNIKHFFQCVESWHCSGIFLSYDYDHAKPDKALFDQVATRMYRSVKDPHFRGKSPPVSFLDACWHVGDDHDQDFVGAIRAGWNGVLLDREGKSPLGQGLTQHNGCLILANNRVVMTNLAQLLNLFEWRGK